MRRALTFVAVAVLTAVGSLWWLHDGDLRAAVEPVLVRWDADALAAEAGIALDPPPLAPAPEAP